MQERPAAVRCEPSQGFRRHTTHVHVVLEFEFNTDIVVQYPCNRRRARPSQVRSNAEIFVRTIKLNGVL
jgi:hypothetical protein